MAETVPIACTLSPVGLAAQGERWHRLMSRAMTERAETADGLRIWFRRGAEDELRALVAVETECCPWATWTVGSGAGGAGVAVASAAEGCSVAASVSINSDMEGF